MPMLLRPDFWLEFGKEFFWRHPIAFFQRMRGTYLKQRGDVGINNTVRMAAGINVGLAIGAFIAVSIASHGAVPIIAGVVAGVLFGPLILTTLVMSLNEAAHNCKEKDYQKSYRASAKQKQQQAEKLQVSTTVKQPNEVVNEEKKQWLILQFLGISKKEPSNSIAGTGNKNGTTTPARKRSGSSNSQQ
ncbi:MAG TPA: hypothetical protein VLG38_05695 [Gammaproteobacteria bacterium]|nr:hypothetical protein [Gammaproteobacteria bacterium]